MTTRRRAELVRISPVEEDGHVRRVARDRNNINAPVSIEIGTVNAAGVLARTGLAHVLWRAELDFLGASQISVPQDGVDELVGHNQIQRAVAVDVGRARVAGSEATAPLDGVNTRLPFLPGRGFRDDEGWRGRAGPDRLLARAPCGSLLQVE